MIHIPVLKDTVLDYLITSGEGIYFDATIGFGGHTSEILNHLDKNSRVIGCDKDEHAYSYCRKKFSSEPRVELYKTSFTNIDKISKIEFIDHFDGILADLGVSSFQLDDRDSGFTYRDDSPLDLRMDKTGGIPASEVINTFKEEELADIIFKFGEEKKSRKIARKIVEKRVDAKISRTSELRTIIEEITPDRFVLKTLSRVFQAFRIYVNSELEELKVFLEKSVELLAGGGRLVIISFHSLEDRIVKEFFKYETLECICPPEFPVCKCGKTARLKILTKKPLVPGGEEILKNKRARSAKLRAAERL